MDEKLYSYFVILFAAAAIFYCFVAFCSKAGEVRKLKKKDPKCLEYVMIHELCHLIEFNHGEKFKKLIDKFCPDWKKIKKELNE